MGLVSSTSGGRRCGASSNSVTTGQSTAATTLPTKKEIPGKVPPADHAAPASIRSWLPQQQHEHVQRLLPEREAEDAAVQRLRGVRERGVGERVLAEQRAVGRVHDEAEHPRDADPHLARLVHAPEGDDEREQVRHAADVLPREQVERERRERGSRR